MQLSIFHKLSKILWGLAVIAIVVLACYVSLGRLLSANLESYQSEILGQLNARTPLQIEAEKLSGEWHSFTPELVLSSLRLGIPEAEGDALELSRGRVGLDVLDSLRTRSLQFTTLQLEGLDLRGELSEEGRVHIPGLTGSGGQVGGWLRELLLNVERVTLTDNTLNLRLPSGETRDFSLNLRLARDGSRRELRGELLSTSGTRIQVIGQGLGDPFERDTFRGELYLKIQSADLAEVKDLLADSSPEIWAEGLLDAELWLAWERGEGSVATRLAATDVVVIPAQGDWRLPLKHFAFEASLVEQRNRWTVFASEVSARSGEIVVNLPRVQVDAWGRSLRVRASGLELEPLNGFLIGLEPVPEGLANVFGELQPQGQVSLVQMSIGDIAAPAQDWELEANFENVQVQAWHGAPGVTGASGYAEFSPGTGEVVIDSQQFTMNFPKVYRQPLFYDDFYGSIDLDWDQESLLLHSGVVTTHAAEGRARGLFRLNIPFTPTDEGLEMDLMVGLQNSQAIHRAKYVPYILSPTLTDWLAGAISEGQLEQAGFIWRGSLRAGARELRTVQLFLNIADTALDYHPDWPAVVGVDGTVLINDTNVSVWVDQARLYQSQVEHLSAEAWIGSDAQMRLAINGRIAGSAADGLAVVNNSRLGELVSGVFDQWELEGGLHTRLQLELNLADKDVLPEIDVSTVWENVDLKITPGDLTVESINGELQFSSDRGFSSSALGGTFWGEPLTAQIGRLPEDDSEFDMRRPALALEFASHISSEALQSWLQQDVLALASGRSAAQALLMIAPQQPVQLRVSSDLQGMALDLPTPWAKQPGTISPLLVTMPLGGDSSVIDIALEDVLNLQLDVGAGQLHAAALGVSVKAPPLQAGELQVIGSAELLDVTALESFIGTYLMSSVQRDSTTGGAPESSLQGAVERPDLPLRIGVDRFQAQRLSVWSQNLADVTFSLELDSSGWMVDAKTDWLWAKYRDSESLGPAELQIEFLDMAGLSASLMGLSAERDSQKAAATVELEPLKLPHMIVKVADLRYGDIELGQFAFELASEGLLLRATDITGDIAGMTVAPAEPAQLRWQQGPDGNTQLTGRLQFGDLGETLQHFGYEKFLETDEGQLDLDLYWPGAPQSYSLLSASGSLQLETGRGRFLETPAGATGALRVVGILNLADLVQRLSLSQMFESGIPFDKIKGRTSLQGGTITVSSLAVQGASSGFEFSGVSDVASRQLEGELVATLPVANNLPWVAALAGGLPVAAGVFVVSKVFEKQMKKLSSGVYTVSGSWDDPEINFSRIFDDSSRGLLTPEATDDEDPGDDQEADAASDPNEPATETVTRGLGDNAPPDPQLPPQSVLPSVSSGASP